MVFKHTYKLITQNNEKNRFFFKNSCGLKLSHKLSNGNCREILLKQFEFSQFDLGDNMTHNHNTNIYDGCGTVANHLLFLIYVYVICYYEKN